MLPGPPPHPHAHKTLQARTKEGVAIARSTEANKYSQAELQLMRTQDVGYLGLKAQAEAKVGGHAALLRHGHWARSGRRYSHTGGLLAAVSLARPPARA